MKEILTFGWWIYVLVMMIPQIFIWEGVDMLFIKFFVTVVMLAIPMIFWNDQYTSTKTGKTGFIWTDSYIYLLLS